MQERTRKSRQASVPVFYNDLEHSLAHAWSALHHGATDRRSLFHTPVFATSAADGRPSVRTVVLRDVSPENASLRINADRRSGKLKDLSRDPRCGMMFYDPGEKLQIRLDGTARVHCTDEIAESAWNEAQEMSRLCYTQSAAPGDILADPNDAELNAPSGRQNFCAILMHVQRIEWLYLNSLGHRRAAWTRVAHKWSGAWVAP